MLVIAFTIMTLIPFHKTQHLGIICKIKAVFSCFYYSLFDASFCYLVKQPIHVLSNQVIYCFFLQYFDMFIEKEIMYRKWNTALTGPLIWTYSQNVLFCNIFCCFCLHCAHEQIIIILIFLIIN